VHIRIDDGSEFTTKAVRDSLGRVGVATLYIEPRSPWENGYVECFNGKRADELMAGEVFDTMLEAKVVIERGRVLYNTVRQYNSLGYRPPAPETIVPWTTSLGASLLAPTPIAGVATGATFGEEMSSRPRSSQRLRLPIQSAPSPGTGQETPPGPAPGTPSSRPGAG
jgi:hypothetical protein